MAAAVTRAKVKLNKSQIRYKRSFENRLRCGKAYITADNYVSLDVQDGISMDKLVGPTEIQFTVLDRSTGTLVIQQGGVVERINSDPIQKYPTPSEGRLRD